MEQRGMSKKLDEIPLIDRSEHAQFLMDLSRGGRSTCEVQGQSVCLDRSSHSGS